MTRGFPSFPSLLQLGSLIGGLEHSNLINQLFSPASIGFRES